jgi:hypothetical protein
MNNECRNSEAIKWNCYFLHELHATYGRRNANEQLRHCLALQNGGERGDKWGRGAIRTPKRTSLRKHPRLMPIADSTLVATCSSLISIGSKSLIHFVHITLGQSIRPLLPCGYTWARTAVLRISSLTMPRYY